MNLTEYNAMPEGDTKLAVRTAVTCGWRRRNVNVLFGKVHVFDTYFVTVGSKLREFNPFTDTSIPYGLIGRGVDYVQAIRHGDDNAIIRYEAYSLDKHGGIILHGESKTHAILSAFCAADPSGHWAKFLKGE